MQSSKTLQLFVKPMSTKQTNRESQVLDLLKSVLTKAVPDPKLVEKIYTACEKEITAKNRVAAFEQFCKRCDLPNLEKKTVADIQRQFEESFGKGAVSVVPHPQKKAITVEVVLPNETFEDVIKVGGSAGVQSEGEGDEPKPKFVPFPVCLEGDPELVWALARHENMTPEEAAISLTKAQDDFWESKTGQKLLRDRVERSFPEFIARVPSKVLIEVGLKRHYKEPEPVKLLRTKPAKKRG